MRRANGAAGRLLPHTAETVLTAVAFVVLHSKNLVADVPLWGLLGLLVAGAAVRAAGDALWSSTSGPIAVHARVATRLAPVTAIIYATGWGPSLALGYIFTAADNVRLSGSRAAAPVAIWSALGIGAGQLAIAAGIAPSFVAPPLVHSLAVLAALGVVMAIRLIGTLTLERELAQERLQASEEALRDSLDLEREAAERLRALDATKTSILQAVSHELRTPLTVIKGLAYTLKRPEARRDEALFNQMLERLAGNSLRLEKLLTDLLDLDRLSRGIIGPRRRPTQVQPLIERVVDSLYVNGRAVTIEAQVEASVDPAQVERIVENLVSNALRHTPAGTPVTIRATAAGGGLALVVEDEGAGVPPSLRESIFEPFVHGGTRAHSPGTGIGLSLVSRFAALHGGRVWVDDAASGGAAFHVWLPDEDKGAPSGLRITTGSAPAGPPADETDPVHRDSTSRPA